MECGQVYTFTTPEQFWAELDDLISVSPDSSLDTLDYALRNYVAFVSNYMDEYLVAPGALDHALIMLLEAPLFTSHRDRMTLGIIEHLAAPTSSSSTLFVTLMLVLHLGEVITYPTNSIPHFSGTVRQTQDKRHELEQAAVAGVTVGSSKVFRLMRKRWSRVVPVLVKWVTDAGVVEEVHEHAIGSKEHHEPLPTHLVDMPEEGWEERVGVAATAVLYEVCRVQKLSPEELAYFTFPFISHLFSLVERTRDAEDETFNYTLIKLIIALNEQFMVSALPVLPPGSKGQLPPPILPSNLTAASKKERERGPNFVLETLKERGETCKTFGENIIFILNRADGTPDSLCVALLILKVLYLLFTTSGTQEFFYTNDLCVLVDVFIRELHDLGEESEGLKHTYLRVLHPLMTNTQLRHHPYKRPELRKILETLIRPSLYREVDATTRRLVERNLRGTWCAGLKAQDERNRDRIMKEQQANGSTLSVDAVAVAQEEGGGTSAVMDDKKIRRRRPAPSRPDQPSETVLRRRRSLDDGPVTSHSTGSTDYADSPLSRSVATLETGESTGLGLRMHEKHAMVDQVARSSIQGATPELVKTSFMTFEKQPIDSAALSTSPAQYDSLQLPPSIPSIEAGHDLLDPIARTHLVATRTLQGPSLSSPRSNSVSHPPLDPPHLVHPRPRSTSLSAHSTLRHTNGQFFPDDPEAPPLPWTPSSPSPLSSSVGELPKRRRAAPPPPGSGDSDRQTRPRTPTISSPLPPPIPGFDEDGSGERSESPKQPSIATTARRRPPPPPSASPKPGIAQGFESLRVS
ncbi:Ldb17p [Sporobolomyces koalae]|uniref:Ldb17p n=1 Tax=Sporobolomyces koalae TaxID=500713 RepID=UPI0031713E29